ncbi:hypothetical protein [Lysobacter tyrosinilyticus]
MNVMPLVVLGMVPGAEGKSEGEKGGAPATPAFVDILIEYALDGSPSAHPDPAYVRKGGTITWHTQSGVDAPFEILPKVAWIDDRGPSLDVLALQSHLNHAENWQEVKIGASSIAGTYPYGIRANGITVDPDVVIKPR